MGAHGVEEVLMVIKNCNVVPLFLFELDTKTALWGLVFHVHSPCSLARREVHSCVFVSFVIWRASSLQLVFFMLLEVQIIVQA